MKTIMRIAAAALVFLFLTAFAGLPAWAALTPELTDAPTDAGYIWCDFNLSVQSDLGLSFMESIDAVLYDINGGNKFSFKIGIENYALEEEITGKVASRTTYKVYFDFFSIDRYALVDSATGAPVDEFAAFDNGVSLSWRIIAVNGARNNLFPDMPSEHTSDFFAPTYVPADRSGAFEEAQSLFGDFLAIAQKDINPDGSFASTLRLYVRDSRFAEIYSSATGNPADDWGAFSAFERFLWYHTYVHLVDLKNRESPAQYFSDENNFLFHHATIIGAMKNDGLNALAEAFENLLLWQLNYYNDTGSIYNFMTGTDYNEDIFKQGIGDKPATAAQSPGESKLQDIRDIVITEIKNENAEPLSENIWEPTVKGLRGKWFTLLLLVLVAGALAGVIIYRKKKDLEVTPDEK